MTPFHRQRVNAIYRGMCKATASLSKFVGNEGNEVWLNNQLHEVTGYLGDALSYGLNDRGAEYAKAMKALEKAETILKEALDRLERVMR